MFIHKDVFKLEALTTTEIEGKRFYNVPGGEKYPSVTTVLGYVDGKKEKLQEWRNKVGHEKAAQITRESATRGTQVHTLVEKLLRNETIDQTKINPISMGLFAPMQEFFIKNLEEVWALEQPVYSHKLKVAGRTDIIGKINGQPTIIDVKTSRSRKKREWITHYFMQCAAYAYCIAELEKVSINTFVVVIVDEASGVLDTHWGKCSDYVPEFYKLRQKCPL